MGINQTISAARDWQILNSLISPVLADSDMSVTGLFTGAAPWVAIIDDNQFIAYTDVSYEDSTAEVLISILDTMWTPEAGVSAQEIDFGEVDITESAQFSIWVENSRTGVLEVESAEVNSLPYTVIFTPQPVYAVDDSVEIVISFTPLVEGEYYDTLRIGTNAGEVDIAIYGCGTSAIVGGDNHRINEEFCLFPARPNPFNGTTLISFHLPEPAHINIEVFNVQGETVSALLEGNFTAGDHSVQFTADNLPSGLYFCRLNTGSLVQTQKMLYIK